MDLDPDPEAKKFTKICQKIWFSAFHKGFCTLAGLIFNITYFKYSFHVKIQLFVILKQCCGSRMFIPDPGSWFLPIPDPGSRIPDPKTATEERGQKFCCHTFFCSYKFHKILNYFIFELLKKKIWAKFQKRIIECFTQKVVTKLSKI